LNNSGNEIYKEFYYQKFLESIEDKFILPKTNYMNLGDFVNKDYRMAYKLVKESVFLTNQNRNYLLYREIDRIANSFSNKDFLEYFARFEKDVADTTYINHIRNKYSLKFNDKKNETNSLVLMSSNKKQITFDDLKKRHAGKLIYVDFWASWCAPCRKALPFSIKIKDKNKDVVFVYLSMDSTIDPWQKALIDENLNSYAESYLIVNSETSNFLKKQNVSAIPRYMIFDRKGALAFANAPSAESKELEANFAKLLK
jgi:thiol-disulfide isomerase/thioredoxin